MPINEMPLGIIAYAGQSGDVLLAKARALLDQYQDHIPKAYAFWLPVFPTELIVNMDYIGDGRFAITPQAYHQRLSLRSPSLYVGDNLARCLDAKGQALPNALMLVDTTFCLAFSQYEPFLGDQLILYPIGESGQATLLPERLYPRYAFYLRFLEKELGIVDRAKDYRRYIIERIHQGDSYDAIRFARRYLQEENLTPCTITQSALGRVMQGHSLLHSLTHPTHALDFFTSYAKKAQQIPQYEPSLRACDTFEVKKISRTTARLLQLSFHESDPISPFWLPYDEATQYIDPKHMILDTTALCQAFQLAPCYDPTTNTALYPSIARVVVIRDATLPLMVASTLNNPAYGHGTYQNGKRHTLIYLSCIDQLLKKRKIIEETPSFHTQNSPISSTVYAQMLTSTYLQELKGNLIDAMYCRHCALSQIKLGTAQYQFAKTTFTKRVTEIKEQLTQTSATIAPLPLSGYDADIDYLTRMWHNQEDGQYCKDMPSPTLPFATDVLRTMSIECGYAMRNCFLETYRQAK